MVSNWTVNINVISGKKNIWLNWRVCAFVEILNLYFLELLWFSCGIFETSALDLMTPILHYGIEIFFISIKWTRVWYVFHLICLILILIENFLLLGLYDVMADKFRENSVRSMWADIRRAFDLIWMLLEIFSLIQTFLRYKHAREYTSMNNINAATLSMWWLAQ